MGSQEDAELVRRGYEAFNTGDMETLGGLFAEDAVWHVAGSGELSGTKRGRDAILAYFGELGARSGGKLKATLEDVVAGESHTVALQHSEAEKGGSSLEVRGAFAFKFQDGKVTEVREYFEDTAKGDAFWS